MLATQIGYAGRAGDYYPADACSIPAAPYAAALRGQVITKAIPLNGTKYHVHLKNITRTEQAPAAGPLVAFGTYSSKKALSFSFYAFATGMLNIVVTSTLSNGSGEGKFIMAQYTPSSPYIGRYIENASTYAWEQNTAPSEFELMYEAGRLRMWVDGVLRIDRADVLDGPFRTIEPPTSSVPVVMYNPGWKYDLVDFTCETADVSVRFVPMKSADGQNALYEVYTQQVAEI